MILKGFFAIELSMGLRELEEYLKTTEKYLQKAATDFKTWADEQASNLSPEERDEFYEVYSDGYWDYAETFPKVLRNSFLVSAYSLLEHKMAFVCKQLQKDKGLPLSWNDLKGDTSEQFKKYCNLASLPFSFNNHAWQEINNYSLVRNCIVHNNGLIKGFRKEQKLHPYAMKRNIVEESMIFPEVRPRGRIALTEQFCREVIKTIWAFLSKVLEAYESQRETQKQTT